MLNVFVSSTFVDLEDHRKCVCDIIRQLGCVDVAMEHMGARDDRPKDECLRMVREGSDAFVGIYAHRYGNVPLGESMSITELEYEEATKMGLKRLIYMLDDGALWKKQFIDYGPNGDRLNSFKSKLRNRHVCKSFSNKDQLAASVAADIAREFAYSLYPTVGSGKLMGRTPRSTKEWNEARAAVYSNNRDVFLAHTLRPSSKKGQKYELAIYLIPHHSNDPKYLREDLADVAKADFFLGGYFNNRVFTVKNKGGALGIVVSAYGPFLCSCRVTFSDGKTVMIDRYIDFEMGSFISGTG